LADGFERTLDCVVNFDIVAVVAEARMYYLLEAGGLFARSLEFYQEGPATTDEEQPVWEALPLGELEALD
jgi:hypothetical protein